MTVALVLVLLLLGLGILVGVIGRFLLNPVSLVLTAWLVGIAGFGLYWHFEMKAHRAFAERIRASSFSVTDHLTEVLDHNDTVEAALGCRDSGLFGRLMISEGWETIEMIEVWR